MKSRLQLKSLADIPADLFATENGRIISLRRAVPDTKKAEEWKPDSAPIRNQWRREAWFHGGLNE